MALTLVATAGAPNANTYSDLADLQAYLDARPSVSGGTITDDATERAKALLYCTQRLEQLRYRGTPASPAQALQHPRYGVPDPRYGGGAAGPVSGAPDYSYGLGADGPVLPGTALAPGLKRAHCELTAAFLEGSWKPATDAALAPNSALALADGTQVTLANDPHALPPAVVRELRGLVCWPGAMGTAVRG